jgi:hypothetical protein
VIYLGTIKWAGPGFNRRYPGVGRALQGLLWPELTFSLVLTAARLPYKTDLGKLWVLLFRGADQYVAFRVVCEEAVPMGCGRERAKFVQGTAFLWGACTHVEQSMLQLCNSLVRGCQ